VQTEYYMHDGSERIMYIVPDSWQSHFYIFNPATDEVLFSQTDGVYATLTDHLGTVHDLVNQASTVVNHFVYDAFGNMVGGTAQVHWRNRIGFAGAFFEAATGLQYNHHRWYDPQAGRWISEDPIGFDGGDSNLARYVGNQVTTHVDPSGLQGAAGPFTDDELASLRSAYRNEVLSSYMANRNPMSWPNYLDLVQRPGESARAPEYTGPCMRATDRRMVDYWDWQGRLKNGRYTSADLDSIIGADRGVFDRGVFEPGGGFDALMQTYSGGRGGRGGQRMVAARRPYIRSGTRAAVEANAPRNAQGLPIDPNLGTPIMCRPDLGHRTGREFWRERARAEAQGLNQKQFNDRMNDPGLYQLEDPISNRSHRFEQR
jgi:RHS repeat-associated protein